MTAIIVRGDARQLPLPDASVDLVCTSPPYWVLRDYQDAGGSLDGQIGNENTPELWLDAMCDCIPFGGTGTTALVASALGRIGISVDLSHDYSRLAQWRTTDPPERAKALHVDKPPPVLDGQLDMWEGALT